MGSTGGGCRASSRHGRRARAEPRLRSTALPIDDLGVLSEEITHLALEDRQAQLAQPILPLEVLADLRRRELVVLVAVGRGDRAQLALHVVLGDEELVLAGDGLDQEEQL